MPDGSAGPSRQPTFDTLKRENEDLEEQLRGKEKRLLRLKEVGAHGSRSCSHVFVHGMHATPAIAMYFHSSFPIPPNFPLVSEH